MLLQIGPLGTQMRQAIDHVLHQMEPVQVVLHPHVEGRRDRALFLVAPDVEVAVGPAVGQPVDQPGVAMKAKDDVLVFGEERIVIRVAQPVRVLAAGLQLHQIDDIDHPDLQIGQMLAKNGNGGQNLQRGRVAAAGHHHVRLAALIVAGPLPDANSFRAMHDRGVHGQPLRQGVFAGHHHVDVMPAAQAMIEDRQQAIGIGRQIHADDVGLLVDHVVEEAGILVREAVVILLPDVGGEQIVQRGDLPAPRQFQRYLQPLGVLAEHRVDDANEGLIAVEQPVPPGQQISFQPTLALVLAEHRVQHASGGREEFVVLHFSGIPLTVGDFKDRAQEIRERLIGAEDAEIALLLIQLGHVTQELAQHERILAVNGTRRRHVYRVRVKVRHAQVAQQNSAVGVRIGAHPPVALRRQFGQFRQQAAIFIEQFLGLVAFHPAFKLLDMIGMLGIHQERHLVRAEGALDLQTIDDFRSGPALG